MTSLALSVGCALVAFCPSIIFFLLLVNKKTHLTIIATMSAFFQLLSILLSSILYLPLRFIKRDTSRNNWDWLCIMLTSIALQNICKYFFVKLYRIVESFLLRVLEKGREDQKQSNWSEKVTYRLYENEKDQTISNYLTDLGNIDPVVQLKLELNDMTCALASGIGFGGMHAIILYGTLLVSQVRERGTLFQPSCKRVPSLIPTAVVTCFFSVLDVIWMFFFFYVVRKNRIRLYNHQVNANLQVRSSRFPVSGRSAMLVVIFSHTLASFSTVMNILIPNNGCFIVLPCLFLIVVATFAFFWIFIKDWFISEENTENRAKYCNSDYPLKQLCLNEVNS